MKYEIRFTDDQKLTVDQEPRFEEGWLVVWAGNGTKHWFPAHQIAEVHSL